MNNYNFIIGPTDTDSISFCKLDGSEFLQIEIDSLIKELNSISPEFMQWENDGYYKRCLALKAKNYILWDGQKKIIKGSAFKDGKKEPALRQMLQDFVDCFLNDRQELILDIYKKYIREAYNITDINRWTVKKTITKPVLTNCRTNERKIREALGDQVVSEGEKVYLYSAIDGEIQDVAKGELLTYSDGRPKMIPNRILKKPLDWTEDQDVEHYIERVYKTLCIFENLINIKDYPNFSLKRNKKLLKELIDG